MGYPAAYRSNFARSFSPRAFNPGAGTPTGPTFGYGPVPVPDFANDNSPGNSSSYANARRGISRGMRIATRVAPLLSLAYFAYEVADWNQKRLNPAGARMVYYTPNWTVQPGSCGGGDFIKYQQGWPSCAAANSVISPNADAPSTGPIASAFIWNNVLPFRYYINGQDVLGDPGTHLMRDPFGPTKEGINNHVFAGTPMFNAPGIPRFPSLNPGAMPILAFTPTPIPIPWAVAAGVTPNPLAPLSVQASQGYSAASSPLGQPAGYAPPIGDPGLGPVPGGANLPSTAYQVWPAPRPLANGQPANAIAPQHQYARPPKGTREAKFIASPGTAFLIRRLFDAATEIGDFVDALYASIAVPYSGNIRYGRKIPAYKKIAPTYWKDPLGKWHKRWPSTPEKAEFIWKHLGDIDLGDAIQNLAENEIKDRIFGKIGKASGQAARRTHEQGLGSPSRGYQLTRH